MTIREKKFILACVDDYEAWAKAEEIEAKRAKQNDDAEGYDEHVLEANRNWSAASVLRLLIDRLEEL